LIGPQLPEDRRIWIEKASFASKLLLIRIDLALLNLAAKRAASFVVSEDKAIGLAVIVEVFFELLHLVLPTDLGLAFLLLVALLAELEFEGVGYQVAHLLVDQQLHFPQPHPRSHHHH
jgi:hypothetical protein